MADRIRPNPVGKEFDNKCFEVAFNYVNICAGSKTESYRRYLLEHSEDVPECLNKCAYEFFKHKKVQEYIEKFRAENRAKYEGLRDDNIAMLRAISDLRRPSTLYSVSMTFLRLLTSSGVRSLIFLSASIPVASQILTAEVLPIP